MIELVLGYRLHDPDEPIGLPRWYLPLEGADPADAFVQSREDLPASGRAIITRPTDCPSVPVDGLGRGETPSSPE